MEIIVMGLNHKTAPVELREKLSIRAQESQAFLHRLKEEGVFDEQVLLSTCNRTEIYGVTQNHPQAVEKTKKILSAHAKLGVEAFEDKLYILKQPDSVRHLFSVASGMDSMVLGETEITGQVKDAYLAAHSDKNTGKVLNNLFQRSLKVAKNLRTHTEIGVGRVSVASVAVDLAEKIFDDLSGVRVMVLGTGEMATQLLKAMTGRGAHALIVSSHHPERALDLAQEFGGEVVGYHLLDTKISEADILIASTSAANCLIREPQVQGWMKTRHQKPLFLVDIAVPRNIEAAVERIDNVYLYNVDDLKEIAEKNKTLRENQVIACSEIVKNQTQFFMDWLLKEFGGKTSPRAVRS